MCWSPSIKLDGIKFISNESRDLNDPKEFDVPQVCDDPKRISEVYGDTSIFDGLSPKEWKRVFLDLTTNMMNLINYYFVMLEYFGQSQLEREEPCVSLGWGKFLLSWYQLFVEMNEQQMDDNPE